MSEHLGQKLKELHKARGIATATAAAKLLGVTRQAVTDVYKKPAPGNDVLVRYTEIVGRKPEDLLTSNVAVTTDAWSVLIAAAAAIDPLVAATMRQLSIASQEQRKAVAAMVASFLSSR
jgi:hypothetical protein